MRRGIVLHLLARGEVILAGTFRRGAQIGFADPAGQRAVARTKVQFCRQHLLDAHPIAARTLEGRDQPKQNRRRARGLPSALCGVGRGSRRRTQDAAKGVTRQLQQPADLA